MFCIFLKTGGDGDGKGFFFFGDILETGCHDDGNDGGGDSASSIAVICAGLVVLDVRAHDEFLKYLRRNDIYLCPSC